MPTEKEKLLIEIENLRKKLNLLADSKESNKIKLLQTSQELDLLLNKYQRLLNNHLNTV